MVLRGGPVGGDVVRRAAVLELVQPGRDKEHRKGLPVTGPDGLPRSPVPADAGLLAEAANAPAHLQQYNANAGQPGATTAGAADDAQLAGQSGGAARQ